MESTPTQLHQGTTLEQIMNLRPRDKDKEIGPPSFRYQPKSSIERVYDTLIKRTACTLPPNDPINKKSMKLIKKQVANDSLDTSIHSNLTSLLKKPQSNDLNLNSRQLP